MCGGEWVEGRPVKWFVAARNLTGVLIMASGAVLMVPGVLVIALGACLTDYFRVEKYQIKDL